MIFPAQNAGFSVRGITDRRRRKGDKGLPNWEKCVCMRVRSIGDRDILRMTSIIESGAENPRDQRYLPERDIRERS